MEGLLRLLFVVLVILMAVVLGRWTASNVTIIEYQRGLLYRRGRFIRLLDPGRYVIWKPVLHQSVTIVDMRLRAMVITGQDILTKDQVNVKLSLVAQYRIVDLVAALHKLDNFTEFLHQELQLALRAIVAAYASTSSSRPSQRSRTSSPNRCGRRYANSGSRSCRQGSAT